jgi:glycosyltransferase involved in cell wall biosynthesis
LWLLGSLHRLSSNLNLIRKYKPDIIWVRDPWAALLVLFKLKNTKVILEIHTKSSTLFFRLLHFYNERLYCFPINPKNEKFLIRILPKAKYLIAPMGIDAKNLAKKSEVRNFVRLLRSRQHSKIKIGYVGKFSPQHYSKGVEDLILVAHKFHNDKQNFEVTLVGYLPDEKKELIELISNLGINSRYLKLRKHMPHSKAIETMKKFDILVMPLPKNKLYQGMPLKLLEYLSVGKVTIIAKADLTTDIFQNYFVPFYYEKNNPQSLYNCIFSSLNSKDLCDNIMNGVSFASRFTWQSRTKNIMNFTLNKI